MTVPEVYIDKKPLLPEDVNKPFYWRGKEQGVIKDWILDYYQCSIHHQSGLIVNQKGERYSACCCSFKL